MSISDRLQELISCKSDIKAAIEEKGVKVTGGLSTYAECIRRISGGGSGVSLPPNTKFGGSTEITYIPFFDTSQYTNMRKMFSQCYQMLNVPPFNTYNVTTMAYMFEECNSLSTVPLFDTSKVTSMAGMFSMRPYDIIYPYIPESQLTSVPLFATSKVTSMSNMFEYCVNLPTVPLFDTSKVTDMSYMFKYCVNLPTVPLFATSKVTSMSNMFKYCKSLTSIPQFDTSSVTSVSNMFYQCEQLTTIPLLDFSNVDELGYFCYDCIRLQNIGGFKNLGKTIVDGNGLGIMRAFYGCHYITRESCVNIFNNLYDLSEYNVDTPEIRFESMVLNRLTDEDISIVVGKGWIISVL